MIKIHFDYVDGTEVSYAEGLHQMSIGASFSTCCLDFLDMGSEVNEVIVVDKLGNKLSRSKLLRNDRTYTDKYMRAEHNLQKMLKAGAFNWQVAKASPMQTLEDFVCNTECRSEAEFNEHMLMGNDNDEVSINDVEIKRGPHE